MRDNNYYVGKGEIINNNEIKLFIQRPVSSRRKRNNSFNNINNIGIDNNNYKQLNMNNNNITKEFSGHTYKKRLSSPPIYSGILNYNNYRKNIQKLDFNHIDNFQATNLYIKKNDNIPNKMIFNDKAIYNEFNYLNE